MKFNDKAYSTLSKVLESGTWGTIGHHSVKSAAMLAEYTGAAYGLLTQNLDTAYESVLRGLDITHGDAVIVPEVSAPALSLVPVCVGARPVFVKCTDETGLISVDAVKAALADKSGEAVVKAVAADYIPGKALDLAALSAVCKEAGVALIVAAHGYFSAKYDTKPLADYADAVIYTLGLGSEMFCEDGGFVGTNSVAMHSGAFAYHNCGRSFGEGCSLDCDKLIGGDARITEWSAGLVRVCLENPATAAMPERENMASQPVFSGDYCKKMVL